MRGRLVLIVALLMAMAAPVQAQGRPEVFHVDQGIANGY